MDKTSPIAIAKIALGTVQFGLDYGISNRAGQTPAEEVRKILVRAAECGINFLDTAYSYGDSERVLGKLLPDFTFRIVSKFPKPQKGKSLKSYVVESLSLLKIKRLYAYMAHDAQALIDDIQLWGELIELRELGIVSKVGYSLYSTTQLRILISNGCKPDIVQVPYNVFDRRFESEFETLKAMGAEIHVRSAFLQGLFFLNPEDLPSYFDSAKPLLRKMRDIHHDNETLAGALITFCIKNPYVHQVVVGVNNLAQLSSNLASLKRPLPIVNWDDFSIEDESILLPFHWPRIDI